MGEERTTAPPSPPSPATPASGGRPPRGFRRRLRLAALALAGLLLLCLAAVAGALVALRTTAMQGWLTEKINASLAAAATSQDNGPAAGVRARITHLSGALPFTVELGLECYDGKGLWLRLPACSLEWDWRALPAALRIAAVRINNAHLLRLPDLPAVPAPPPSQPLSEAQLRDLLGEALRALCALPGWLPDVRLDRLSLAAARLPQSLLGLAANGDEENAPDARIDASLTLFGGTAGARAEATVSLSGEDGTPLRLAATPLAGAEATVKASVVPVFASAGMLGANADLHLSAALHGGRLWPEKRMAG